MSFCSSGDESDAVSRATVGMRTVYLARPAIRYSSLPGTTKQSVPERRTNPNGQPLRPLQRRTRFVAAFRRPLGMHNGRHKMLSTEICRGALATVSRSMMTASHCMQAPYDNTWTLSSFGSLSPDPQVPCNGGMVPGHFSNADRSVLIADAPMPRREERQRTME